MPKTKITKKAKTTSTPPVKTAKAKTGKAQAKKAPGQMRGLDAAARILAEAGEPMGTKELVARMLDSGLWQTKGKTPSATIYSAILREIAVKRETSRFRKTGKGKFSLAK
jgi:hypothetical protein